MKGNVLPPLPVKQIFRIGDQRRPLSARSHVPDPEVRHHRHANLLAEYGYVPDLIGSRQLPAQIGLFFRLVINRLAVAANEIDPAEIHARLAAQLGAGLQIQLSKQHIHSSKLLAAAEVPPGDVQNSPADLILKRNADIGQLLHPGFPAPAVNPDKNGVHSVGRGAAHQSDNQLGALPHQFPQRHSFTLPRAMPATNCFCRIQYRIKGTKKVMVAPAMMSP